MANTKHLIKHICYLATINGRNFRTKLALYVICILNISCETFLFKSSYLSQSLSLWLFSRSNYGSQMEYVSHYTQSQEAKKQVGVGKHETIHNTREKWRRPFLVLLLLHSPLYPSLSSTLSLFATWLIVHWPLLFFQLIGNKLKGMLPFNKSCFVWLGLTIITCVW